MPIFFFDIHDGNVFARGLNGFDFVNLKEASAHVARALVDLAKDRLSEDGHFQFTATVRDGAGAAVTTTTLSITSVLTCATVQ